MKHLLPALLLILMACSPSATPAALPTLTGTFTLYGNSRTPDCHGTGGYGDVAPGLSVTVKDEAGVIVGSGSLRKPESIKADMRYPCVYPFTVHDVGPAKFYSIEVGDRGALTYSTAEMEAQNWTMAFTLGD